MKGVEKLINLTLAQAKAVIEKEGKSFKDMQDEILEEIKSDIFGKKVIIKAFINQMIIEEAEKIITDNYLSSETKNSKSNANAMEQSKFKDEQSKGDN